MLECLLLKKKWKPIDRQVMKKKRTHRKQVYTLFPTRQESCEFRINLKEEAFGHLCALISLLAIKTRDCIGILHWPLRYVFCFRPSKLRPSHEAVGVVPWGGLVASVGWNREGWWS